MASTDFAELLEKFFLQWMMKGRQLSARTISTYSDAFAIFLHWMHDEMGVEACKVTIDMFTAENVERFLQYLSNEKGNCATTTNCRLAAIKAFGSYAAYKVPERLFQMKRISDLPRRREKRSEVNYLTTEEIGWLKTECKNEIDHIMVSLLFNTGARVSELISIRACDFSFSVEKGVVKIFGKGRKERTLPLWEEVVTETKEYLARNGIRRDEYLFAGRNVEHLTRSGVRSRIESLVAKATLKHPSLAQKKISPHVFRHSTAMAMLEAGVDISTIAIWLGHESIQTTHRYMATDMKRKEEALKKVHDHGQEERKPERYHASDDILSFLNSL
ncbi:MAG: tyrosine-type recombinase/integrase [Gordonibacter sp.]